MNLTNITNINSSESVVFNVMTKHYNFSQFATKFVGLSLTNKILVSFLILALIVSLVQLAKNGMKVLFYGLVATLIAYIVGYIL